LFSFFSLSFGFIFKRSMNKIIIFCLIHVSEWLLLKFIDKIDIIFILTALSENIWLLFLIYWVHAILMIANCWLGILIKNTKWDPTSHIIFIWRIFYFQITFYLVYLLSLIHRGTSILWLRFKKTSIRHSPWNFKRRPQSFTESIHTIKLLNWLIF